MGKKLPDLDSLISAIGWSRLEAARRLNCDEKLIRKWTSGELAAPAIVGAWLAALVAAINRLPAPDWRNEKTPQ
jgi:inorganic pyrophosphatase/exopolyphosphatase